MTCRYRIFFIFFLVSLFFYGVVGEVSAQVNTMESVLSKHTWYKIAVTEDGFYKMGYADLQNMGVDLSTLDPRCIALFGNESGLLSQTVGDPRPDDLREMAIVVAGEDDGIFGQDDYVMFYGQASSCWKYSAAGDTINTSHKEELFVMQRNYFSDTTYYFMRVDGPNGLRVQEQQTLTAGDGSDYIDEYLAYQCFEEELMNPYSQGWEWYGSAIPAGIISQPITFDTPDLIEGHAVNLYAKYLARSVGAPSYCSFKANGNTIYDKVSIQGISTSSLIYGRDITFTRRFNTTADHIDVEILLESEASGALLFLDFIQLNYWRKLRYLDGDFRFEILPSQSTSNVAVAVVESAPIGSYLWDITDVLRPQSVIYQREDCAIRFGVRGGAFSRFVIFEPDDARSISVARKIENQNLHGIDYAEMLIITHRDFRRQAESLAQFHHDLEGLTSVVVDVDDIYNEFSTGRVDVTGIRDFIKMVYRRAPDDLKYVLLFGDASYDYRNIKGAGGNFVPIYENQYSFAEVQSFISDDYYGIMDESAGHECKGVVCLGVGRIPVSTVEQADNALKKIHHYVDQAACQGPWRNNMLLFTDNESGEFIVHSESLERYIIENHPSMNLSKVYVDAFKRVSTPSGFVYPEANKEIMERFQDGVLMATYTGHGGVRGLTNHQVFTNTDIQNLTNYDKLIFFHTATCEFTKLDNPEVVSAGELMFLSPNGGAIALFTTTRPTFGSNNLSLSKSLYSRSLQEIDGSPKRFGDIVRESKSTQQYYNVNNVNYVLLGDPALRLAYPKNSVNTVRVNGIYAGNSQTIHAMSMVSVEGELRDYDGKFDPYFNGYLYPKFFDKATEFVTNGYNPSAAPRTFSFYDEVLYEGRVLVKNGRFSFDFQVPYHINYDYGVPRMSYYAYDTIRCVDAHGVYDNMLLGGVDEQVSLDHNGPDIVMYWNDKDFRNGDLVPSYGTLYIDLFDEQGIYHYDVLIGRNLVLDHYVAETGELSTIVLNKLFEPSVDDYRRGGVKVPMSQLSVGTHEFRLKAWDTQDNSSEATLWLVVDKSLNLVLTQVVNSPNPFVDETYFSFRHDREDMRYGVVIDIYDILGRKVRSLETVSYSGDNDKVTVRWDGRDANGGELSAGVYLYRISVTDQEGNMYSTSQRLVKSN